MSDQYTRDGERNETNRDNARRDNAGISGAGDTAGASQRAVMEVARNVGEQARTAAASAQDLARRAGEQTYEQGQRAGEYLTRNVNEYPLAALMVAGAIGYGIAYLVHSNWQNQGWNWSWSDERRRAHRA